MYEAFTQQLRDDTLEGVYLTWLISALALGVILLPVFKPKWMELRLSTFVDFFRRYWIHILILFLIYNAKDGLDEVDRILMANTGLDMTPWLYAIEGDLVLHIQQYFEAEWLTVLLTHFYVAGFMFICYVSVFYFAYFDDRWMADRVTLTIAWVYLLAVPFYLFFNVRVTGDYIPEMETLAYSLNPEISDWFRRIDPFTNCMPSLHIAIPYSVWLCLRRFDHDQRWLLYRRIVMGYVLLTAFTIIYLGIHWILDIGGGMIVASIAVNLADRTSKPVWNILDERTINSRLVSLLTSPKKAIKIIFNRFSNFVRSFAKPTSRETGIVAVVLAVLIISVITWDLTHQSLSPEGVEAPEGAVAADGWLATLDNTSEFGVILKVHDLSDVEQQGIEVIQPNLDANASFTIHNSKIAIANNSILYVVNLSSPSEILYQQPIANLQQMILCSSADSEVLITLSNNLAIAKDLQGNVLDLGLTDNVTHIECKNNDYGFIKETEPMTIYLGKLYQKGAISYEVNATAEVEDDEVLEFWNTPVDYQNAKILDFVFDENYIFANVNVSSVDRLVLIERNTGDYRLIGDVKYPSYDPSLNNGVIAWAMKDHLNPSSPIEEYFDGEIMYMNLSDNFTHVLTADELDQWGPIVLENHIVYFEESDDGVIIRVQSWVPELKTYSNIVLQFGALIGIILIFVYFNQRQIETRDELQAEEE